MTTPRNPRALPGAEPRQRPSDERAQLASAGRATRRLAQAALVLAVLGLGLAAWRTLAPAGADCQAIAWDTTPRVEQLPLGWSVGSSRYDLGRKTMTLLGPLSEDETSQAVLYATITCYPQGAADSVTRSADAATAAGQTVVARTDLGEQGFSAIDGSNAVFLQFRYGNVVVYLAASSDASPGEVELVAGAFDRAMGGDGPATAAGTPDAAASPSDGLGSPVASEDPAVNESPVAPELEAALPTQVGDTPLTIQSALGSEILANDRIVTAALRAAGKEPDDLRLAEAFDPSIADGLWIRAISVTGMKTDELKAFVLGSLLLASSEGVKTDTVTLAGQSFTRVDIGDGLSIDYVLAEGDHAIIIETADAALAEQAAAALP